MSKIEKNEMDVKRLIHSTEQIKPMSVTEKYNIKNNFDFFTNNTTHSFKRNFCSTIYSYNRVRFKTLTLNLNN